MKVNIDKYSSDKLICVNVSYSDIDEIQLKDALYTSILSDLIIGHSIKIVTIAPESYSLAYEIDNYDFKKIAGKSFLINSIAKCDLELLEKIVASEEFRRSLLLIVKTTIDLSDAELIRIIELIKSKPITSIETIFFCQDDGNSLCLCNTVVESSQILLKVKLFVDDIEIQGK